MLSALGVESLDGLLDAAVPRSIRSSSLPDIPGPMTEPEVLERLRRIAAKNQVYTSLIGLGYHDTHTPAVVLRNVLENPGWYTAYTPYQPEISQGRLEALLVFQTVVIDLTGLEVANASLLDEPTAAAEAMAMSKRLATIESDVFFVDAECHPQTVEVLRTRAEPIGIEVVVGDPHRDLMAASPYGVLLQYPGGSGLVRDDRELIEGLRGRGVFVCVAADLLALTLLTPPGEMGADIVVGTTQRFGVPLMFGGPHAAYMATRDEYKRSMPGRIVGVSKDANGRMALRLALATREQHIRREKATSNICTAQVLLAVMAAMYAVYHGPEGLRAIADRIHHLTSLLVAGLRSAGLDRVNQTWFDSVTVAVPGRAEEVVAAAEDRRINLRLVDQDHVGISRSSTPFSNRFWSIGASPTWYRRRVGFRRHC
jgi:glycine dehydrogenase